MSYGEYTDTYPRRLRLIYSPFRVFSILLAGRVRKSYFHCECQRFLWFYQVCRFSRKVCRFRFGVSYGDNWVCAIVSSDFIVFVLTAAEASTWVVWRSVAEGTTGFGPVKDVEIQTRPQVYKSSVHDTCGTSLVS